jgi:hypothetical protein
VVFVAYPKIDDRWFHGAIRRLLSAEQIETRQAHRAAAIAPEGYRYFRILEDGLDCRSSAESVARFLERGAPAEPVQAP